MTALASHQCGPGSNPVSTPYVGWVCCWLLVLSFAPRGFSPGTPVFPSPQKPTFPNSNSTRNQVDEEPLCGCATSKSLFMLFYFLFISHFTSIFLGLKIMVSMLVFFSFEMLIFEKCINLYLNDSLSLSSARLCLAKIADGMIFH